MSADWTPRVLCGVCSKQALVAEGMVTAEFYWHRGRRETDCTNLMEVRGFAQLRKRCGRTS